MTESIWKTLSSRLPTGTAIPNWTAAKGLLGNSFTVFGVGRNYVEVESPNAKGAQRIPVADFEQVHKLWAQYINKRIDRSYIRDMTRFSKYIISILHWIETGDSK